MTESTRLLVGDVIAGKYRIDSVAGEGGMGIVYEAEHVILRQRVAIKAMLPGVLSSTEALERFSAEAAAIARITCEHVVRVMDAGTLPNGAPYLVMEYLEGCDLAELLSRRPPPSTEVVDLMLQALEGLAHAHAAHVVHRDLKSSNLFLARLSDGRDVVKLLDFGVAVATDVVADEQDERLFGSPRYMSPEQLRKAPLDARADLWSLGVVLYELLSGEAPFTGTLSETVAAILERSPTPLHVRNRAITPELSAVVARCLERDPEQRWGSSLELARALAPHGSGTWEGAVERIERALSNMSPRREPRRFETLDTALSALDSVSFDESPSTHAFSGVRTTEDESETRPGLSGAEAFDPTVPLLVPAEALTAATLRPAQPRPDAAALSSTLASGRSPVATHIDEAVAHSVGRSALRILAIDDSEFVLGVHSHLLKKAGFDVQTTTSPREFDELLERWKPHLVLMAVEMPGVTGDKLCRMVKARFKATVPVVFVSDLPRAQLAERAKRAGADAFLSKSSDWAGFIEFVRNICAITYSPEHLP
jgi:serine/threonine-protein kinase